jgi:hypothetical protein
MISWFTAQHGETYLSHLEQVLHLLSTDHWQVKLSKCSFAQQEISYLGHVISKNGVSTDPSKVSIVSSWPVPTNARELRGFLGLVGYYRKFVKNFGILAKPLTNMLKKHTVFVWTTVHDDAFQALKTALSTAPVLALPDFHKPFSIEIDASGLGIGADLQQEGHPLAFVSKAIGVKILGLSAYEKEYMAILFAVEHWRAYLLHAKFYIYTDHRSLSHLDAHRLHTPWQQKVFTKLLGLQYPIIYKKGVENNVNDALSRRPHPEGHLFALSSIVPAWLQEVASGYQDDLEASKLLTSLAMAKCSP